MSNEQPEALMIAECLEGHLYDIQGAIYQLRNLHEINLELIEINKDLVEALESMEMTAGIPATQDDPVRVKARAAIAKARGEG